VKREYKAASNLRCPECHELCDVIPLDNSFSYSGTHCTGGRSGTHYPAGYGDPVSDCCEADLECDSEGECTGWEPDEDNCGVIQDR